MEEDRIKHLNCPFCDNKPIWEWGDRPGIFTGFIVKCSNRACNITTPNFGSIEEAFAFWDNRFGNPKWIDYRDVRTRQFIDKYIKDMNIKYPKKVFTYEHIDNGDSYNGGRYNIYYVNPKLTFNKNLYRFLDKALYDLKYSIRAHNIYLIPKEED